MTNFLWLGGYSVGQVRIQGGGRVEGGRRSENGEMKQWIGRREDGVEEGGE